MRHLAIVMTLSALIATAASAQSPYAGQQTQEVKALSPQEVDDYLNGRGMGLAKVAELNHFPGPRHVLDLATELALSPAQKSRTKEIFKAMKAEAIALGAKLVEKESELNQRFGSGAISPDSLAALSSEIGTLQGKLRYVHLRAHLEQRSLLTKHQIQLYDELRGYAIAHDSRHSHSH